MKPSDPVRIIHWDEATGTWQDVTATYPLPVSGGPGGDPVITVPGDTPAVDAFQRSRVSNQGYRADAQFTYDKLPILFNEVPAGAGTATHDGNLRAVWLSTAGLASGDAMRFTLQSYTPYTAGNSQQVIITGTMNPDNADFTNVVAEIGYGDGANAAGFRYDENGAHVFLRSSISGAPVDLEVADEASWSWPDNGGVAPFVIDWTKSQIFMVDFQSLAVGRIRFFLDHNGLAVKVHEITNDNVRVGPYWQTATLPPFWSVTNTDVANEVCRVLAICCTVKAEGAPDAINLPGFNFSASRGVSLVTVSTTLVPVMSIRLLSTFKTFINRGTMIPIDIEILTSNNIQWAVFKNSSLTGASWNPIHADSFSEFDIAATALTGGRNLFGGYASSAGNNRAAGTGAEVAGKGEFSINAAGVSDIMTLAAIRAGTSDAEVAATINIKEVR